MRVVRFSLALFPLVLLLGGCVIVAPPREVVQQPAPVAQEPAPAPVVGVYEEPPLSEPAPVAVGWAPPPMLVEVPPPPPFPYAVWVGGYWVWQGNWVWAHGQWMAPPRADYVWVHPYYEHRGDVVIFINGHWSPPGVVFVPPPPGLRLVVETPAVGIIPGPRPIGPEGCFVPAPPGSRHGIIVPAPVGTAPAVVTSAPPVVAVGMRVTNNVTNINNTNINNTRVTNITNVTNVTNVTIVAPPGATANGRAFNTSIPAVPHLAAARPALVQARAPDPVNARRVMPYVAGHAVMTPSPAHPANAAEPQSRPAAAREGPPARNGASPSNVYPPVAARAEGAAPARPAQGASSPPPKAMTMKSADKAPAAGTATPQSKATPNGAPAHTDLAKMSKPDAPKDAQGHQKDSQRHQKDAQGHQKDVQGRQEGKHDREGQ